MDIVLIVLVVTLFALIAMLFINGVLEAKNMRDLGLVLVVFGLFFGWPWAAIGAGLVIAHYYKE